MVSFPVGALLLPVPAPAPAPAKFSSLFADASKDPMGGNWDALMPSFLHDVQNSNNNTDTNALCKMVTLSGMRNNLISFTVPHRNRERIYTLFMRWKDGLTGRNPSLNGKFFTLEGGLILDHGHVVEIDVVVFSLPITVVVVPIAAFISDALARDPALNMIAGSYAAGDPGIGGLKTRKICTVPHPLEGMWLLDKDGITWQKFFWTIYPAIVNKGSEDTYLALIQFMQKLAVREPATIN